MKYTKTILTKLARGEDAMGAAAAAALELIKYSGSGGETLDLSMETYDYVAIGLMMAGIDARKAGQDKEDIRHRLAYMAAAYEMFTLCGFLNTTGEATANIEMRLPLSPNPVLCVTAGGKKTVFDLFGLFEKERQNCFVFPAEGVAVELAAAREKIQSELFEKL